MPFTFSHPALIIPLLYRQQHLPWLSSTGLIAGSIAPDFEKFLNLNLANSHSHTLASIFYFSCPVALMLSFIFHLVVRKPLIWHLPTGLHRRMVYFESFDWLPFFRKRYVGVFLSIIIGATLHLFWDSFTHRNVVSARWLSGLNDMVVFRSISLPIFSFLSLSSTFIGGLVIFWCIWKMPTYPSRRLTSASLIRYWGIVLLVALTLLIEWMLIVTPKLLSGGITAISATLLGILISSVEARKRMTRH